MDFEASNDVCYTGLGLGLACHDKPEKQSKLLQQKKKKLAPLKYDFLFPPLSLGPPEVKANQLVATKIDADLQPAQQASSFSAVSSFSNSSSVKRERDFGGGEEVEGERLSNSRVSDEDEEGSPRKKLRLTKEQSAILEDNFKEHSTLNPKQKQALAEQLNLRPRQVEVWFQNRRARTKLKQTELDCELLKKCCETLTEENKRLHNDLQELKLKLASPVYMHLPAATLSMCPSCERICSGGEGTSTSAAFAVGPKTHFRNPFTHPSAAC